MPVGLDRILSIRSVNTRFLILTLSENLALLLHGWKEPPYGPQPGGEPGRTLDPNNLLLVACRQEQDGDVGWFFALIDWDRANQHDDHDLVILIKGNVESNREDAPGGFLERVEYLVWKKMQQIQARAQLIASDPNATNGA